MYALAQLERALRDFTLATQNVDSLHLRAGSQHVARAARQLARSALHALRRAASRSDAGGLPLDRIEHACGGRSVRISFGSANRFPPKRGGEPRRRRRAPDVILVVGTSAVVYPAAALATSYNQRAFVAEINPEADRDQRTRRLRAAQFCK